MASQRKLLNKYKLLPKKRFGQNFLIDPNIVNKILKVFSPAPDDIVVEIGPGIGALTIPLSEKVSNVIAIELDRDIAVILKNETPSNVEVINEDALIFNYLDLKKRFNKKLRVIANLPYNISTPIIFKLLEKREVFTDLTLMLQKEVATRIVALPGVKDYGVLSVMAQLFAEISIAFTLSPSSFYPKPEVHSSVVKFELLEKPRFDIENIHLFRYIVKAAFGKRRKTLKNALQSIETINLSSKDTLDALKKAGIDPIRRGETLKLEEFKTLYDSIKTVKKRDL
jgi:16S rRNA (adenine1518-N6/adenine1519-N6)-dimethyltransferase